MTREQLRAIARRDASGVIASVPGGTGYDTRVVMAVEIAMNQEWWRGYYAGIDLTRNLSAGVTTARTDALHEREQTHSAPRRAAAFPSGEPYRPFVGKAMPAAPGSGTPEQMGAASANSRATHGRTAMTSASRSDARPWQQCFDALAPMVPSAKERLNLTHRRAGGYIEAIEQAYRDGWSARHQVYSVAQLALVTSQAEIARLNSVLSMFREMADAAEAEYWAYNRAHLDIQPSRERVFDALRLLGRYPPPGENIIGPADGAEQEHRREGAA